MRKLFWVIAATASIAVGCQDRTLTPGPGSGQDATSNDGAQTTGDSGEAKDSGPAITDDTGVATDTGHVDTGAIVDSGFADSGVELDGGGSIDTGIPGGTDAGNGDRDGGFGFDIPRFDFGGGFFDGTLPSFDGAFPRFDGGVVQTDVTMPNGGRVLLDLMPPVDPDPLRFSAELVFDNSGAAPEMISITNARVFSAIPFFAQDFQVEPDHLAPIGVSMKMVMKAAGSGSANPMDPMALCNTSALLTLEVSNGQRIVDLITVTCVM